MFNFKKKEESLLDIIEKAIKKAEEIQDNKNKEVILLKLRQAKLWLEELIK